MWSIGENDFLAVSNRKSQGANPCRHDGASHRKRFEHLYALAGPGKQRRHDDRIRTAIYIANIWNEPREYYIPAPRQFRRNIGAGKNKTNFGKSRSNVSNDESRRFDIG